MISSVYLAYPIDQRGPASLVSLFDKINEFKCAVTSDQRGRGVSWVYDPGDAFLVNPSAEIEGGLAAINRAAVIHAQGLVAFLPAGVPSIGVPIEIDRARSQGKPVLVLTDARSWMLQMHGVDVMDLDTPVDTIVDWCRVAEPMRENRAHGFIPVKIDGDDQALLPSRGYRDDAGLDLYVADNYLIAPKQFMDLSCGISMQLPERHWGMITGRSSTFRKKGLLVHTGIIDTGYRGPLFAGVWNTRGESVEVKKGERIAQLLMFYNTTMHYHPEHVPELGPSQRGANGFGSTGA